MGNIKKIRKLIDNYCKRKIQNRFRCAVRQSLTQLNSIKKLNDITKILAVDLTTVAYIDDAEIVKIGKVVTKYFNFDTELGISGEITVKKHKRSIARLISYCAEKITQLEKNTLALCDLRKSISLLLRGESEIITCTVCDGRGETDGKWNIDKNEVEKTTCWQCDGNKKIIQKK